MSNPYLEDDDDSDLYADENAEPASTKHQQFSSERDFILVGPNGEELPEKVQEAIGEYVGGARMFGTRTNLPLPFQAMASMYEFYNAISMYRYDAPLLAAVAQVVDEMTNGRVNLLYRKFEAERKLMYTKALRTFSRAFIESFQSNDWNGDWTHELVHYFSTHLEITEWVHHKSEENYRTICAEIGEEVDEELIETGKYAMSDFIRRLSFNNPPALDSKD